MIGGQLYHYRFVAGNSVGVLLSSDLLLTTTREPEATTLPATGIGPVGATLQALVRPNTLPTSAWFEFGLTAAYEHSTPTFDVGSGSSLLAVSLPIYSLVRTTSYHFRVVASNSFAVSFGADRIFATSNDVYVVAASNVGMTNAVLNGLVNPNNLVTSVRFEYGTNLNFENVTPAVSLPASNSGLLAINCPISGLTPGGTYFYRAVAENSNGIRRSDTLSFQALAQFSSIASGLSCAANGTMVWGDYDNDGRLDLLVSDAVSTRIYRNLGNGTFATVTTTIPAFSSATACWGDLNNDDRLDLLISGISSGIPATRIYLNDGANSFIDAKVGLPNIAFRAVLWRDFDNDGRTDVLLAGEDSSGGLTRLFRNRGDGTFEDSQASLPGYLDVAVAVADYDNDGRLDIFLTGRLGLQYANVFASLLHNDGAARFHSVTTSIAGARLGFADWGDYDGDGYVDLVVGGAGANLREILRLYRNNHDGSFSDVTAGLPQFACDAALWGDFDNDGRLDLLIRGQKYSSSTVPATSYSAVLRNNGDGTFLTWNFPLPEIWTSCGGWVDYDSDGRLDVVMAGGSRSGRKFLIYHNNNPAMNHPPASSPNLWTISLDHQVAFAWSPAQDPESPPPSLTYNLRVGTTPGGGELVSPLANSNGLRSVIGPGNAGTQTQWTMSNLPTGIYYWSIQAVDATFTGGPWAPDRLLVASPDSDLDGLPDVWENAHGLSPAKPSDADLDSDGDGYSNSQEYAANTDPQDPESALSITAIDLSAPYILITFRSAIGRTYQLQGSSFSPTGPWNVIAQNIPGTGDKKTIPILQDQIDSHFFFQIVLQQ